MGVVTLDDVRTKLLNETPVQWPVLLQQAERRMGEAGFTSLRDFIVEPITKGGLGISLERARELLYFNPAYKHKADELADSLGIKAMVESGMKQEDVADELGITQGRVSQIITSGNKNKNARGFGWMPKSASDAAQKIRDKFGDDFADELKAYL